MLVLVPAYLLLVLHPERYESFMWLPIAAQLACVGAVGYSIMSGETKFSDGILPVAVSVIFAALLAFVWVSEQRAVATEELAQPEAEELKALPPSQQT
jgi:hypothetical protein